VSCSPTTKVTICASSYTCASPTQAHLELDTDLAFPNCPLIHSCGIGTQLSSQGLKPADRLLWCYLDWCHLSIYSISWFCLTLRTFIFQLDLHAVHCSSKLPANVTNSDHLEPLRIALNFFMDPQTGSTPEYQHSLNDIRSWPLICLVSMTWTQSANSYPPLVGRKQCLS
jgi:hypothetical protein